MSVFVLLFMVSFVNSQIDWKQRCTHVSSITGKLQYVDRQNYEMVMSVVINTNIGLHETICFKLETRSTSDVDELINIEQIQKSKMLYELKFTHIEQIHAVHNSYKAVIPEATRNKCYCDCPCYADRQLYLKDFCEGQTQPCIQIYRSDSTSSGCIGNFLCTDGTSDTLCSFSIVRDFSQPVYEIQEIGSADTWVHFQLNVYDENSGKSVAKEKLKYNLQHGHIQYVDLMNSTLSVASSGVPNYIQAGWYYKREGSSKLFTGIDINGINSWNLEKFGWLRWKSNRIYFPAIQKLELKSKFSYRYSHCTNGELIWQFHGRYSNKEFEKIKHTSLEEKESARISSIESNERLMRATLTSSPRLNVFLEIKETADVVFYYDKSELTDFSACLQIDKFSNRFLNVSLIGAAGSLTGFLLAETIPNDYHFSLYVDSIEKVDTVLYARLPSNILSNKTFKNILAHVCLRTFYQRLPICKTADVEWEPLQDFQLPNWSPNNVTGGRDVVIENTFWDHIVNFFKHLNPLMWITTLINNISSLFGWLGMLGNVIIIGIIITVSVKIKQKCFPNLCKCNKKRKKEHGNTYVLASSDVQGGNVKEKSQLYEAKNPKLNVVSLRGHV